MAGFAAGAIAGMGAGAGWPIALPAMVRSPAATKETQRTFMMYSSVKNRNPLGGLVAEQAESARIFVFLLFYVFDLSQEFLRNLTLYFLLNDKTMFLK